MFHIESYWQSHIFNKSGNEMHVHMQLQTWRTKVRFLEYAGRKIL